MANSFQFSSIICLFFLVGIARSQSQSQSESERFTIVGQVYCDTCRAQFITRLSKYMPGAKVRLQCRDPENAGTITYAVDGVTDNSGTYHLDVTGDHEDEVCDIGLIQSSDPDCEEVATSTYEEAAETSKVTITNNNGIVSSIRNANPIGFKKREALPECAEVFQELGIVPDEN